MKHDNKDEDKMEMMVLKSCSDIAIGRGVGVTLTYVES